MDSKLEEITWHLFHKLKKDLPTATVSKDQNFLTVVMGNGRSNGEHYRITVMNPNAAIGLPKFSYDLAIITIDSTPFDGVDCTFYNPNVLIKFIRRLTNV